MTVEDESKFCIRCDNMMGHPIHQGPGPDLHLFTPRAPTPAGQEADEVKVPPRRINLVRASSIKPKPVRFLWDDRIPAGAITLIPGREGIGKSLALTWLTGQITRGTLPGIHYGTPKPVIYAATEDSWEHTIVPRLIAAGADLDMVFRVDVITELGKMAPLTLPVDTDQLADVIRQEGVAMLALDPLLSVVASSIDTHRDRELRTALEPLAELAGSTGCAVVGLAHHNKSSTGDALNAITGSRAFSAVARAVMSVARDPDDEEGGCILSQSKNNLGRMDVPSLRYVVQSAQVDTDEGPAYVGRLHFTGESERSVSDVMGDSSTAEERGERNEAAEWLGSFIEEQGETRANEVFKEGEKAGFSRDALKRAKSRSGVESRKASFGAGWVWALKDDEGST